MRPRTVGPTCGKSRGPAGFKAFLRPFRTAFPNMRITIVNAIVADDNIAVGCAVIEVWNNLDFLAIYQQLGMQLT